MRHSHRIFQTVNHTKVLWDPNVNRGTFWWTFKHQEYCFKEWTVVSFIIYSNLDFLCISETWLHQLSSPSSIYDAWISIFRRDRSSGRGVRVLIYVRNGIKCERLVFNSVNDLEYVGLNITLSPQMSLIMEHSTRGRKDVHIYWNV